MKLDNFLYATQYYRDPTPLEEEMDFDLPNLININLNVVQLRLNWRYYERVENEYDFSKVDRILEKCQKNNIKVIVKFMLECAPQYIFEKYNGTRIGVNGEALRPGSHGAFYGGWRPCFTNKKVLERAVLFVKKLTNHIKHYDCIILYNIWNEIRNKPFNECFCPECRKAFGNYLKDKFKTIENLNNFYGTAEESFETINLPSTPHGLWDTFEFKKFKGGVELANWLRTIYKAVKSEDDTRKIMAHVGIAACLQHDLEDVSNDDLTHREVDFFGTSVGCDSSMASDNQRLDYLMLNDYMSAVDEDYVIHEIYPGLGMFKWYDTNFDLNFKLYAGLSKGTKGLTFWQYRAERVGHEGDCAGLVGIDGEKREITSVVDNFGNNINRDGKYFLNAHRRKNDIGIVYDFDSQLISEIEDCCGVDFKFEDYYKIKQYRYSHSGFYKLLTKSNYGVDYVLSSNYEDFKKYKVLIFPYYNILKQEIIYALKDFCKNGGVLILDEGFALRDENTWMNPYEIKVDDLFSARYDNRQFVTNEVVSINNKDINIYPFKTTYRNNSGKPLLFFKDSKSALTEFDYGAGKIYLFGFSVGYTYEKTNEKELEILLESLLKDKANKKVYSDFQNGFYSEKLTTEKNEILFLFNTSNEEKEISTDITPISISDQITLKNGKITVEPSKMGYIIYNK